MPKPQNEVVVERLKLANLEDAEMLFSDAMIRIARVFHEHAEDCDEEGRGHFQLKDSCLEAGFDLKVKFRHDPVRGTTDVVVDSSTTLPKARTRLGHVLLSNDKFVVEKEAASAAKKPLELKDAAK